MPRCFFVFYYFYLSLFSCKFYFHDTFSSDFFFFNFLTRVISYFPWRTVHNSIGLRGTHVPLSPRWFLKDSVTYFLFHFLSVTGSTSCSFYLWQFSFDWVVRPYFVILPFRFITISPFCLSSVRSRTSGSRILSQWATDWQPLLDAAFCSEGPNFQSLH